MEKKIKKFIKILTYVILIIFILFIFLMAYNFIRIKRGDLVKWDGMWYTKKELQEEFPPQVYEVEAKNTPEEVYSAFRQALLDGELEKALEYISEDSRDKYKEAFRDEEKLDSWIKRLPEDIEKEDSYGNFSSYYYKNNLDKDDQIAHPVRFVKNNKGYWEIEAI